VDGTPVDGIQRRKRTTNDGQTSTGRSASRRAVGRGGKGSIPFPAGQKDRGHTPSSARPADDDGREGHRHPCQTILTGCGHQRATARVSKRPFWLSRKCFPGSTCHQHGLRGRQTAWIGQHGAGHTGSSMCGRSVMGGGWKVGFVGLGGGRWAAGWTPRGTHAKKK